MKNIFSNFDLKNIKQNGFYIFGEICLFALNIYKFFTQNDVNVILLIVLLVVVGAHIFSLFNNNNNNNNIPDKLKFMVDFAKTIGYTEQKSINEFSDLNCSMDTIRKTYEIDGINVKMQKEYIGRVSSNACDGIKIMTCGGSSTSTDDIDAYTYNFDYSINKYKRTKNKLISENERSKVIKIYFNRALGENEQFKLKYLEKNWDGAMRKNYDGIVIGEHLFFKVLKEQDIKLVFRNAKNINCYLYQFNFKKNQIIKLDVKIDILGNECHCSIKDNNIMKNCILFLMYQYE